MIVKSAGLVSVLTCIMVHLQQDFMDDVNIAFEYLLKLTPLLDKADQRCK